MSLARGRAVAGVARFRDVPVALSASSKPCEPPGAATGSDPFTKVAGRIARATGHAWAFAAAFLLVAGWFVSGPLFGWSDTWQLAINTTTTIVTFLMVFIIQNTQTRDVEAMHIKLDALVLNTRGARNDLVELEEMPEKEVRQIQEEYQQLGSRYHATLRRGKGRHRPSSRQQRPSPRHRKAPSGRHAALPATGRRKR
jgi:low affinity Fe/Cu permease